MVNNSSRMKRLLLPVLIITTGIALAAGQGSTQSTAQADAESERAVTSDEQSHAAQSRYLEAAAAAQRGDYVVAYCFWRPLAEQGDAEAQYALGWMYHNGYGLVSDEQAAKGWWEKAIAQGHLDAMFSLGTLYSVGSDSIMRDYPSAMRLWAQAAAAGHANARYALRELAQRRLPELVAVTQALRKQYPQLIAATASGKRNRRSAAAAPKLPLDGYLRSGELLAVAAGYRPELGWAAVHLVKEGEGLVTGLKR